MSFYPLKINERAQAAKNVGTLDSPDATAISATFICGAVLRFSLQIDRENKEIVQAKFKTNGCGYLIAAADAVAEKIVGRFLTDLHSFDARFIETLIADEFGKFPKKREHCMRLVLETLQIAFKEFRAAQIAEWTGEKALICTCFSVSEETIEKAVVEQSLDTTEQVAAVCNAGSGCGSCQPLIQEIIDSVKYDF